MSHLDLADLCWTANNKENKEMFVSSSRRDKPAEMNDNVNLAPSLQLQQLRGDAVKSDQYQICLVYQVQYHCWPLGVL